MEMNSGYYIENKPWGSFINIFKDQNCRVKKLIVMPGEALSLQLHQYRSEHWIVIKGKARVTIGDKIFNLEKDQSIYIPKKVPHRLENPDDEVLEVIEIQIGEYLEEDDIIRLEDKYGRTECE